MIGMLAAPLAELLEFNFSLYLLLISMRIVISALTGNTAESNQVF